MKNVILPNNREELWKTWETFPEAVPMAGGTDLLVGLRENKRKARTIIGLEKIRELCQVSLQDGEILIGAMVTHQQLLDTPAVAAHLPGLHGAAAVVGSPAVRHMGTIGGNICSASPAGDTLPPLYTLGARLELLNPAGSRVVPLHEFILGPGRTALHQREILSRVRIRIPAPGTRSYYFKVGQRKALAISIASMAALLQLAPDRSVMEARFAWGSVGPTVMRFPELEKTLTGRTFSPDLLNELGKAAAARVAPISDIRGHANYRRILVANLPLRLSAALAQEGVTKRDE